MARQRPPGVFAFSRCFDGKSVNSALFISHRLDSTSRWCSRTNHVKKPKALRVSQLRPRGPERCLLVPRSSCKASRTLSPCPSAAAELPACWCRCGRRRHLCRKTKAQVSKAELAEVRRVRNAHTLGLELAPIAFVASSARSWCFVGFIRGSSSGCTKNIVPFSSCFAALKSMNWACPYIRQDSVLSPAVCFWDVINFWFGVFINIQIPQLVFQHPDGCLNSCWQEKKKLHLLNSGWNSEGDESAALT